MFDGIGKIVWNDEYFDTFRMNTLQVGAKIAYSDFQLSLLFGPAESELDLDFYHFFITWVGEKQILRMILSITPKYI